MGRYPEGMKLCRFELLDDPGVMRSGIYYDSRVYETQGMEPVGVHEPGTIRLFPPLGPCPSLRFFDLAVDSQGQPILHYAYGNPATLYGPNAQAQLPEDDETWDFEIRVVVAVSDRGERIDFSEAPRFVLGYSLLLVLVAADQAEREARLGIPMAASRDSAIYLGPFLVTSDELGESMTEENETQFQWRYEIKVNDDVVAKGINTAGFGAAEMLEMASRRAEVVGGDLLAFPPLEKQPLDLTALGRGLLPEDKISCHVEGLGVLVARLG